MDGEQEISVCENRIIPADPEHSRKRSRDICAWKKNRDKRARHSSKSLPKKPNCNHPSRFGFKCNNLGMQDVRRFNQSFYESHNKVCQDSFILRYVTQESPQIKRPRVTTNNKGKEVTLRYYIPKLVSKKRLLVQVCQNAFVSILGISKFRVQRLGREHLKTGLSPKERRGGDTRSKMFKARTENVRKFIESFIPIESHYCRSIYKRQYLSSDLTIKQLWHTYNAGQNTELRAKYNFFRHFFTAKYNISFKTPATDKCSKCFELEECIKRVNIDRNIALKDKLLAELGYHKLRANAFSKLLRTQNEGEITYSFDCQKNAVLPKHPEQAAYYSHQLCMFNFTICEGTSKTAQSKQNTFIYCWTESDGFKSSNEIASCVHHRLNNTVFPATVHTIRLFADGCGGQNKNQIIMGMLSKWLESDAPNHIKRVVVLFPVPGHSFIPPDRVFGRIEKEIRRQEIILKPGDYRDHFQKFGTVICPDHFFNWKKAVSEVLKPPANWHFKFAPTKRFIIQRKNRVTIQGEATYFTNLGEPKGVCRRGKNINQIFSEPIQLRVLPKVTKVNDILNLLKKHYGSEWESNPDLSFYKELANSRQLNFQEQEQQQEEEDEQMIDSDAI